MMRHPSPTRALTLAAALLATGAATAEEPAGRKEGGGVTFIHNGPDTATVIVRSPRSNASDDDDPRKCTGDCPGGGGLWVNNGPDAGFVTLVPAE